jgi:hypothetical protein
VTKMIVCRSYLALEKRGIPPRCCFAMCCSRGPTLGLRPNCDPVGAIAAGEAAHQLMYARRIQRSADRASALAASSSEAFSARRS